MLQSKKILYTLFFVAVLLFSCKSNYQVIHVTKDVVPSKKSGFYYALPKTFVKVDFTVNQQENVKGPYCDYAKKYFGLNNVITQNSTEYKIKDIKIETYSEPDSSQYYFVETNDSKLGMIVSHLGLIETVNHPKNTFVKKGSELNIDTIPDNTRTEYPEVFKMFADLNLYEKTDTIYEKIKTDSSFVFAKTLQTYMVEKPTEQKVKEIFDLISKMRENRFNLLNGDLEVNDKKSIEFMYAELQNLEKEYMKLFSGITLNHTLTYSYI